MTKSKFPKETANKSEFSEEFWNDKIGTWQTLSGLSTEETKKMLLNVKNLHEYIVSNEENRNKVIEYLNHFLKKEKNDNLGKICVNVFLNPTIRIGALSKMLNADYQSIYRGIYGDLVSTNLLDSTWDGKDIKEKSLTGKQPSSRLTPDYFLYLLLCGEYDPDHPVRKFDISEFLKNRRDVVLILILDDNSNPVIVKNRPDNPIPYLQDVWSLPYFFVTKIPHQQKGIHNFPKSAIKEINEIIGNDIAGLSEKADEYEVHHKVMLYFPPLRKGGNPLFLLDARTSSQLDTVNKIIEFMKKNSRYRVSEFSSISWELFWERYYASDMNFHYASILSLAHVALKDNLIQVRSEEIIQHFRNNWIVDGSPYFDLLIASNPERKPLAYSKENTDSPKHYDPYGEDSAFEPARNYMRKYLPELETIKKNSKKQREKVIVLLDKAGKKSDHLLVPSIGPDKRKKVENLVMKHKPKLAYDIGTLFGYSAISLAKYAETKVITIQKSEDNMKIARKVIEAAGLGNRIETVVGDATKKVPESIKHGIDMVLIDGYKQEYFDYLQQIEQYLKPGSIIIADNVDIFEHEMKPYLDHVRHSGHYESQKMLAHRAFSNIEKDAIEISEKI